MAERVSADAIIRQFLALWRDDMFYLLGVLIIASGSILLLGLASRQAPPAQAPRSDPEDEF